MDHRYTQKALPLRCLVLNIGLGLIGSLTGACLEFPCSDLDTTCNPQAGLLLIITSPPVALRLTDTGQTECYDQTNSPVACSALAPGQDNYGQDGHFLDSPRAPDLVSSSDATVTDSYNALQWAACSLGNPALLTGAACDNGSAATPGNFTLASALSGCSNLSHAGHNDWRLPEVHELAGLLDLGTANQIDTTKFPGNASLPYRTATLNPDLASTAYSVSFFNGGVSQSSTLISNRARCVRGTTLEFGEYFLPGNATVLDATTGLYWEQCAAGSAGACNQTAVALNWRAALRYCQKLNLGSASDWRLPNSLELNSLIRHGTAGTTIDRAAFPNVTGNYWTSTTAPSDPTLAGLANFTSRTIDYPLKTETHLIRCVRGP